MTISTLSRSPARTRALAAQIARRLGGGDVIGLVGDLGSGKTCFVKGVAAGLGIAQDEVQSPSFTMVAEHERGRLPLVHVDLYRLRGSDGVAELGLEEYVSGSAVVAVEWFDRLPPGFVDEYLLVRLTDAGPSARLVTLRAEGSRYQALLEGLCARVGLDVCGVRR